LPEPCFNPALEQVLRLAEALDGEAEWPPSDPWARRGIEDG
jgi:hypothetical protein